MRPVRPTADRSMVVPVDSHEFFNLNIIAKRIEFPNPFDTMHFPFECVVEQLAIVSHR